MYCGSEQAACLPQRKGFIDGESSASDARNRAVRYSNSGGGVIYVKMLSISLS